MHFLCIVETLHSQKFNTYSQWSPQSRFLHLSLHISWSVRLKGRVVPLKAGRRRCGAQRCWKGHVQTDLGPDWWDTGSGNRTPSPCSHVNTAMWSTAVRMCLEIQQEIVDNSRKNCPSISTPSACFDLFIISLRAFVVSEILCNALSESVINLYLSSRLSQVDPTWKRIGLGCNASLEFKGLNLSTAQVMRHELA